jgi:hypothetical protein
VAAVWKPEVAIETAATATVTRRVRRVRSTASPARRPRSGATATTTPAPAVLRWRPAYRAAEASSVVALSTATAAPPRQAYRPVPASGATSFIPSCALVRQPLTTASRPAGTAAGSSADSPASLST